MCCQFSSTWRLQQTLRCRDWLKTLFRFQQQQLERWSGSSWILKLLNFVCVPLMNRRCRCFLAPPFDSQTCFARVQSYSSEAIFVGWLVSATMLDKALEAWMSTAAGAGSFDFLTCSSTVNLVQCIKIHLHKTQPMQYLVSYIWFLQTWFVVGS